MSLKQEFRHVLKRLAENDKELPEDVLTPWPDGLREKRDSLIWLAASLAKDLGYTTFISESRDRPVVCILLPERVTWYVSYPSYEAESDGFLVNPELRAGDGHSAKERSLRIRNFVAR